MKLRIALLATLIVSCAIGIAVAEVARSASGKGESKAAALQAAKDSASGYYKERITSWGREECSQQAEQPSQYGQPSQYDKPKATHWLCTVEFTTKD